MIEPRELPTTRSAALARMTEAEDTLRAIGAGEIDAFVVSDPAGGQRVFTLSTADRPYRMFVENMRDGAATLSGAGVILFANERFAQLLGSTRQQIVGTPLANFMSGSASKQLAQIGRVGDDGAIIELALRNRDGLTVPVLVGISPLEADDDQLLCLTFTDLSAQKAQDREIDRLSRAQAERMAQLQDAQAALTMQATHDALTGLPNRGLLVDRIGQALAQSKRSGRCTAILFVDLDRFKQVNDTHGHAAGDGVLQRVAALLVAGLRSADTVARIGGDEFVVLAPDVDSRLHAVDIGTRLLHELRGGSHTSLTSEVIAASIGISVSIAGRGTAESLLQESDAAMYQAKSLGGDRLEVFDETLGRQVKQRLAGRRVLQSAMDQDRVHVYYQPIVELSTGAVAGFEALVRIIETDGSVIPPADFIPVAEDSGLIVPMGTRVLAMSCEQAHNWQQPRDGQPGLSIAVNLSARQFGPGDLAALIAGNLERSGLDPAQLHLELTETAIIDLRPDILRQLAAIRDLGVQIGLDDFGTGYASLTHLRRLPLTFVKIDRSFVSGLETDREDERIVSAVVSLAENLGLRSIAEGVETSGQLRRLRELGCDQAQGYLFARPLPAADAAAIIAHSPW